MESVFRDRTSESGCRAGLCRVQAQACVGEGVEIFWEEVVGAGFCV